MDMGMMDQASMPGMDTMAMQRLIDAASACEQACTMCAGSMGMGMGMEDMDRCRAMCMNCADMCNTTMRMMLRPAGMDMDSMVAMLQATMVMCTACAAECEQHDMQTCRMCAEACREMARACEAMMASMKSMAPTATA